MNTAAYTPLESLLLFQALLVHGVEAAAFARVSDLLKANALIKHDASFDAARLSPDALRQLFLHLVREEIRSEAATAAANANSSANAIATANKDADAALSPNSKKRKAQSPAQLSLKEVIDNFGKIPVLVEKLYARYREQTVKSVREDERRLVALQREIQGLEQAERDEERARTEAKRLAAAQAAAAVPAPSPTPTPDLQRPPQPPKGPSPVPAVATPKPGPADLCSRKSWRAMRHPRQDSRSSLCSGIRHHKGNMHLNHLSPNLYLQQVRLQDPHRHHSNNSSQSWCHHSLRASSLLPATQQDAALPQPFNLLNLLERPQGHPLRPLSLLQQFLKHALPPSKRSSNLLKPAQDTFLPKFDLLLRLLLLRIPLLRNSNRSCPRQQSVEPTQKDQKDVKEAKVPKRGRPSRRDAAQDTPSRIVARSQSVASQADELSMDDHELAPRVKNEEATPRPPDEAGDTTADESGPSRRHAVTPSSVSSRLAHKRKRQDTPIELPPQPASTPTHVLWTRQFGKISNPALDQISSHRCANQFAHAIRERDAPGYKGLILQPQDIKSIRAAMTHGNRAAVEAARKLPDGDPGTPTLWLPISSDLLPPKSIINSEQLERELVHMFSNAIMYNLDPYRGPGNSFMKREASVDGEGDAEPSTYRVDEDAVVRDSRIMFVEVERLLGDLRAAERDRSGLPPSGSGSARPTSVAATPRGESTPAAQTADDDMDELAGDENMGSTYKRRRIGTRDAGTRA
ncbi:hypothetical protein ACHAQA_003695 [Verticillium albo-atrum]